MTTLTTAELVKKAYHAGVVRWDVAKELVELIVQTEREACARFCQTLPNPYKHCQISSHAYDLAIVDYSKAIRARGQV
jgi:hypothetical protein